MKKSIILKKPFWGDRFGLMNQLLNSSANIPLFLVMLLNIVFHSIPSCRLLWLDLYLNSGLTAAYKFIVSTTLIFSSLGIVYPTFTAAHFTCSIIFLHWHTNTLPLPFSISWLEMNRNGGTLSLSSPQYQHIMKFASVILGTLNPFGTLWNLPPQ